MQLNYRSLLLLATALVTTAGFADNAPSKQPSHELGREIYNYRCYFCHGYSGDAKTLASTYLTPQPRDFTSTSPLDLSRETMINIVTSGKENTAMHGFSRLLDEQQVSAVVDFVREEFILHQRENTRYHTVGNGWPNHERYKLAYPFATGSIPLDTPGEQLSLQQNQGKQMFLSSCITCHDRANVEQEGEIWNKQSISYPRNNYSHTKIDAVSSASIYASHDIAPEVNHLSPDAVKGKALWQQNCAFCHAADGTGENWIGSFLEPKPRNLTDAGFMQGMTRTSLLVQIKNGLNNTSMPAWKNVLSDPEINQIISYVSAAFHPVPDN